MSGRLVFPEGLEPVADLTPAAWVRETLAEWPRRPFEVRDLVPPIFDAYARVLHRPHRPPDDRETPTGTWKERASQLDRNVDDGTTWDDLEVIDADGHVVGGWTLMPGSLSKPEAMTLAAFLARHTETPKSCWFAMWSSWASPGSPLVRMRGLFPFARSRWRAAVAARRELRAMAKLSTFGILGNSGRSYLLFSGRVVDVGRFSQQGWYQSPPLWWPEDRAWFVHTETDSASTYLGGSRAVVDRLVGEQILESFEVGADDRVAL